jgi:hypothetical protein
VTYKQVWAQVAKLSNRTDRIEKTQIRIGETFFREWGLNAGKFRLCTQSLTGVARLNIPYVRSAVLKTLAQCNGCHQGAVKGREAATQKRFFWFLFLSKGNGPHMRVRIVTLLVGTALGATGGFAQQKTLPAVHQNDYSASREITLQGKVLEYSDTSTTAPVGAHVKLQTASGEVDVHLGNARIISANHLALAAGDAVTVTGENVAFGGGTMFAARSIQKGGVSVMLRSKNGMPLLLTPRTANGQATSAGAR